MKCKHNRYKIAIFFLILDINNSIRSKFDINNLVVKNCIDLVLKILHITVLLLLYIMNIYNEYITIYITNSGSFLLSIELDADFKIRIKKIHSFYKYIFNKKKIIS